MTTQSVLYGGYGAPATTLLSSVPLVPWQETLRQRIQARDHRERAHDQIIERYQKLAAHAAALQERNTSLLAASAVGGGAAGGSVASHAVQEAYVRSLEGQLATLRDELAGLYKTQSLNAQRLLELNETLRTQDEASKALEGEVRALTADRDRLARQSKDQRDVLREKDATVEMLQDELNTLSLELNQVEKRNDELGRDNAQLLQRWLDAKNEEAHRMNDANIYLAEVERRRSEAPDHAAMPPSPSDAALPPPPEADA